jgi:hypothetical protein
MKPFQLPGSSARAPPKTPGYCRVALVRGVRAPSLPRLAGFGRARRDHGRRGRRRRFVCRLFKPEPDLVPPFAPSPPFRESGWRRKAEALPFWAANAPSRASNRHRHQAISPMFPRVRLLRFSIIRAGSDRLEGCAVPPILPSARSALARAIYRRRSTKSAPPHPASRRLRRP